MKYIHSLYYYRMDGVLLFFLYKVMALHMILHLELKIFIFWFGKCLNITQAMCLRFFMAIWIYFLHQSKFYEKDHSLVKEKQQNSIHSVVVQGVNVFQFFDDGVNLLWKLSLHKDVNFIWRYVKSNVCTYSIILKFI